MEGIGNIKQSLACPRVSATAFVALAVLFASFTLWLVQSEIKYVLFFFEVSIILLIYIILNGKSEYNLGFTLRKNRFERMLRRPQYISLDIFLILSSFALILFNQFHIGADGQMQMIQLFLAFICTSILSGYAILNIFGITKYFSKLENGVFSYLASFIISGLSTLALLHVDENARSLGIALFFILLGTMSLLVRHSRDKMKNENVVSTSIQPASLSRSIDVLAIALCIIFYLIFFYYAYPNLALLPNTDISRHYRDSIVLSRSPDLYTNFSYVLFHSFEAALYVLSGLHQSLLSFQSIQIILNIFLPISVYALAKRFFGDLDRRIPAIATIFYTILSNFSFIYFTGLKLTGSTTTELQLLGTSVAERAYNGTINFAQPFPWFVPLSVSFVMFIMAVLLLKVQSLSRSKCVLMYSVLIVAMYLTHITEAAVFVTLIAVYSFIARDIRNGNGFVVLNLPLFSSLIGLGSAGAFFAYITLVWPYQLRNPGADLRNSIIALLIPILLVISSLFLRWKILPRIRHALKFRPNVSSKFYTRLSTLLVVAYLFGFVTWVFTDDFKTSSVLDIGVVPWFVYPLMLGIVGLLAILAVRHLGSVLPNRAVTFILTSIVVMVLIGKLVSFININLITQIYWEKRFLTYVFLFVCLLAPIPLIKFVEQIHIKIKRKFLRDTFVITVISLVILSGFSSMVLIFSYWSDLGQNNSNIKINGSEFQAINYLKNILQHDPRAFVITPTFYSAAVVTFAAPAYQIPVSEISFSSRHPDFSLFILGAHNLSHPYIYVNNRDVNFLTGNKYGWFSQHLLPMLPVVFSNREVTIYNTTHISFPLSNSDTTMLMPIDFFDKSWLYAYDIVSRSGANYTVMYDKDPNTLNSKTVLLSFDPTNYNTFYDNFSSLSRYSNDQWSNISGDWNYYSDGLHGGTETDRSNNIILSPVSSRINNNFTANTIFKVNHVSASPHAANSISIVYSWTDAGDYKYAGITILNKAVYVSFTDVSDGKTSVYPTWPGIDTHLKWRPDAFLNMSISKQDNNLQLSLNGTSYNSHTNDNYKANRPAHYGLAYSRVVDVKFDDFKFQEANKNSGSPSLSDYITYVRSGGHLTVLNTNGYGSIANYLFNTHRSSSLSSMKSIQLPITTLSATNKTAKLLPENYIPPISHTSLVKQSSLSNIVAEVNIGDGTVTYINIYPILSSYFAGKIPSTVVDNLLGKVSRMMEWKPSNNQSLLKIQDVATFRQMTANGKITVNATSFIFPFDTNFDHVVITTSNHKNISLTNVTKLRFYGNVELRSSDNLISLRDGSGLYANLSLTTPTNDPKFPYYNQQHVKFFFLANSKSKTRGIYAEISPNIRNPEYRRSFTFDNVSDISISNRQPITSIYARDPIMNINHGNTTFRELYYNGLAGRDVNLLGNVGLSVLMSDSYTMLSHLSLDGTMKIEPPLSQYNELASFVPPFSVSKLYSLPVFERVLIIIPVAIAAILVYYTQPSKKVRANDLPD